jgi:poly-gamma-glutamate capsule biosynthesis protein CapA/YwtB (metallophosphatase superfamily)
MPVVLIGADICPIEGNRPFFEAGDAASLFHDLLPELTSADLVVANLECPLIDQPSPIVKTGPTFGESPDCVNGMKAAGIDVLCLANNHIMDHGAAGLQSTMETCAKAGIDTVGAGENLEAAGRILVRQIGAVRVGILAMAEREFSIATNDGWGANPIDVMTFVRQMRRERSSFDYLIVLVHGSAEFHVPTPRIQETCRFLVEEGANAVVVQHPHVLGGHEDYQGGHIVYGQGALLMDEAIYRDRESFHEGFLVKLILADDFTTRMELVPFVQSDPVPGARKVTGAKAKEFHWRMQTRSRAIFDKGVVESEWLRFCEEHRHGYLGGVLGHHRYFRKLNRNGWLTKLLYRKRALLGVRNCVCCETHREAIQTIFDHGMV